jgi:carbohydrate-selective porin OprB
LSCEGSQFGNCCSRWNYCGDAAEYCDGGCQDAFGLCNDEYKLDLTMNITIAKGVVTKKN